MLSHTREVASPTPSRRTGPWSWIAVILAPLLLAACLNLGTTAPDDRNEDGSGDDETALHFLSD
jgi:hypothetical protein